MRAHVPTALATGLASALAMGLAAAPAVAQKEPTIIRGHILDQVSIDVEPYITDPLEALFDIRLWQTEVETFGSGGVSTFYMAVVDGEALRVLRHGVPQPRDGFMRMLPADFRVTTEAEARRMVAASTSIHSRFSEPEIPVDEMRVERRDGAWLFIDGERFGEATGYRITHDSDGRPTGFEYSWELDTAPLAE